MTRSALLDGGMMGPHVLTKLFPKSDGNAVVIQSVERSESIMGPRRETIQGVVYHYCGCSLRFELKYLYDRLDDAQLEIDRSSCLQQVHTFGSCMPSIQRNPNCVWNNPGISKRIDDSFKTLRDILPGCPFTAPTGAGIVGAFPVCDSCPNQLSCLSR